MTAAQNDKCFIELEKIRKQYLTDYRAGLWTQIRAKEDAIWRFISFYAAAIILITGFLKSGDNVKMSPTTTMFLILTVFFVSFWGILITLDANHWMQRNLVIIRNIEKDILNLTDFGSIFPKVFVKSVTFRYNNAFFIQVIFFTITLLFAIISYVALGIYQANLNSDLFFALSQLIAFTFFSLLLYSLVRNRKWVSEFGEIINGAPGKIIDTEFPVASVINETKTFTCSYIEDIFLAVSIFGVFGLQFSTLLIQKVFPFLSIVYYLILCLMVLISTMVIYTRYKMRKEFQLFESVIPSLTKKEEVLDNRHYSNVSNAARIIRKFQYLAIILCLLINLGFLIYTFCINLDVIIPV